MVFEGAWLLNIWPSRHVPISLVVVLRKINLLSEHLRSAFLNVVWLRVANNLLDEVQCVRILIEAAWTGPKYHICEDEACNSHLILLPFKTRYSTGL